MNIDTQSIGVIAGILRNAARDIVLPHFHDLGAHQVRTKSSHLDLVTDADEAAEALITSQLAQAFPGALVVGEEAVAADETALDGLESADLAFVIDPIDGTKNFASGLPLFGMMVAVLRRGSCIAGIIFDPILDDFAAAIRGQGAWTERPDGRRLPLRVCAARPVSEMLGVVSWMFLPEPLRSRVTNNMARFGGAANYRTAAHEYRLVAGGHYDFAFYRKLAPWDHLAGVLIHEAAGGFAACLDGRPYTLASARDAEGLICAPDEASWKAVRATLLGAEENGVRPQY